MSEMGKKNGEGYMSKPDNNGQNLIKNRPTFIDLFAGCGGFSLGLKNAGFECKRAIEIDQDACETYRHNIGEHIICADIKKIRTEDIPRVDVLVGGFPCQPFSLAGLQSGFHGSGGDLFYECVRFIKDLKPKVFVLENVTGFVRLQKGFYLQEAIKLLNNLGYTVDWKILNASDFCVPQKRERLFIIGNSLGVKNHFPEQTSKKISVFDAIEDIRHNMQNFLNNDPMKHTDRIKKRFAAVAMGETALDAMKRNPELGSAKITKQCYRRLYANEPAPTIVANFVTTTIHYCENRNLTAREAARLQSFPDEFLFKGLKTRMSWQKGLSQFEQIGNAVPPKLGEAIGNSVLKVLQRLTPPAENKILQQADFKFPKTSMPKNGLENQTKQGKRGRKSKYESIYLIIENSKVGEVIKLPSDLPSGFFLFLGGAMRRRSIKYQIKQSSDGSTNFIKTE